MIALSTSWERIVSGASSGNENPKICILGGGFGGLYTAVRLEALMWPTSRRPEASLLLATSLLYTYARLLHIQSTC